MAGGPGGSDAQEPLSTTELAVRLSLAVVLLFLAQTFTGLNIGLFALDCGQLQVIIDADKNSSDARHARLVLPLRRMGNLTLCTILLGNTMVNALMALLMAGLAGGFIGWLVTTLLIVYIGEILPQSVCSRHGLRLGALGSPIIWFFVVLLFPITKLYAIILDGLFPDEDGLMDRAGWRNMVEYQDHVMPADQKMMLLSSLDLGETYIRDVMVPIEKAHYLASDDVVNLDTLKWIQQKGVTRIPIYDKKASRCTGLLYCNDLLRADLGVDFHQGGALPVEVLLDTLEQHGQHRKLCQIPESLSLLDLVDLFKETKAQLVFVCAEQDPADLNTPQKPAEQCASPHIGLVTLNDVYTRMLNARSDDEQIEIEEAAETQLTS